MCCIHIIRDVKIIREKEIETRTNLVANKVKLPINTILVERCMHVFLFIPL